MFTTPTCSGKSSKLTVGDDPPVEEDVGNVVDHREDREDREDREALVVLFATTRSLFWESYSIHYPRPSVPQVQNIQHVHQHNSHPTPHHHHHYHPDGSWARGELGKHVVAMEFVQLSADIDDPSAMGDIVSSPTPIRDRARRQRVLEQVHATLWAEHYPSLPSTYLTRHMGFHYQRPAPTLSGPDGGYSATTTNSHLNLYTNPIMGTYCLLIQAQHCLDQRSHQQQHQPQHQRPSPRLDAKQPRSTKHSPEVKRLLQELQERFYQYHEHHPQQQQHLQPLSAPTSSSIISLSLQLGIAGAIQGIFYLRQVLKAPRLFTSHVVRYSVRILQSLQASTTTMSTTLPTSLPLGMSKGLVGILFTLLACSKQDWKQIQWTLQGDSENCEGMNNTNTNSDQSPLMDVRTMVDRLWNDVKQSLYSVTTNDNDTQQPQEQVASSPQPHKLLHHMQWSNGAAGLICLLIRAANVFESNKYFQTAQALADYIWHHYQRHRQQRQEQGHDSSSSSSSFSLSSSSFGLANGMSGIAMSFICVARYCPAGTIRSQWEQKADVLLHHTIHEWHASTTTSTAATTSSSTAVASPASSTTPPCYGIWDGLGGLLSVLFFRFHHQQPMEFPMFPTCHGSKKFKDPLLLPQSEPMGSVMEPFSWATSTTTPHPLDSADRMNRQRRPQLVIDTTIVSPYPVVSRRSYGPTIAISGSRYGCSRRPKTTTTPRTTIPTTATTMTPIRLTRAAQLRMELTKRSSSISSPSTSGTFTTSRIPAVPPTASTTSSGDTSHLVVTRGHNQSQSNVPGRLFNNINRSAIGHTRKFDPSKTTSLDQRRMTLQAEHKAKLVKAKESRRRREEQQAQLRAHRLEAERKIQFEKRRAKLQEAEAVAANSQQRRAQKEREMTTALAIRKANKVQTIPAADQVDTEETQSRKLPRTRVRTQPEPRERANGIRNKERPDQDSTKKIENNRQVKTERQKEWDRKSQDDHKRTREACVNIIADKHALLDSQCPGEPKSPESDQNMLQTTSPPTASLIHSIASFATSMSDPTATPHSTVTSDQHHMVEQSQSMPEQVDSLPESDNEMSAFDGGVESHTASVTFQALDRNLPLPESPDDKSPTSGDASKAAESNDAIAFKLTEQQRKAFTIKLTEDEDFESINAMFAEAESLLESQLASILGPVDGTLQEVAQPFVGATSHTILASYSEDDDDPISSEISRNSHTNPLNDGNEFVSAAAPVETSTEFDRSTVDPQTDENVTLLNVMRVSENATFSKTRNGEGKPLHEPTGDQEVQENMVLLTVTGPPEGTSDSKARRADETPAIVVNEVGADDGGGGTAMTGTGFRGATMDQPPSSIWAVTGPLTTTVHPHDHLSTLAHPHAGSSTAVPIYSPQTRPLGEVAIEPSTAFVQRIDRPSAFREVESSTPFEVARDAPSTMVSTPAAPSQGRLDPSFNEMNHTVEDEEDFDDDFARMDSLFEEAENQLKAELASILGPSPDRNTRHASDEREMDDDVLPSIIEEDAGLSSDSFTDANGTTTGSSKVFVAETDLTPTNMSSFSRGTLRRRGNRKVAPGH